jgi:plastocyanin
MQFKSVALVASAIMFAACGGSETTPATDAAAPAVEAAPATLAPATGTVHEIKMVGDDKGYRFEPAALTIKTGDAVKFVAVSGFPHNVAFNGATLSATVKAQLDANFGIGRAGELMSAMYVTANEGFTLSFANIPAGSYEFNCTPHLAMNMKGVITVQ